MKLLHKELVLKTKDTKSTILEAESREKLIATDKSRAAALLTNMLKYSKSLEEKKVLTVSANSTIVKEL